MKATRRDIIAGLAVPIAAELAPFVRQASSPHPDATLLALREPYEKTLAYLDEVCRWHTPFEDAYFTYRNENPGASSDEASRATGFDKAEAKQDEASSANLRVIERIAATPARTLEGLRFKAEIAKREHLACQDLLEAIAEDCAALPVG